MGTDIHLYAEKKVNGNWTTIEEWGFTKSGLLQSKTPVYNYGRNYNLFAALADVWGLFPDETFEPISDPKGMPHDCCKEIQMMYEIWDIDGHNHSWNTLKELQTYDWKQLGNNCDEFVNEVIPKLKEHVSDTVTWEDIRIVYWFDN